MNVNLIVFNKNYSFTLIIDQYKALNLYLSFVKDFYNPRDLLRIGPQNWEPVSFWWHQNFCIIMDT